MAAFLMKTEPSEYSYADLAKEKKCVWTGVSNNAALLCLRAIRKGDEVLIYHTGDEKAIVGLAVATSDAYEDPKQPGKNASGQPKFAVVDLKPVRAAKKTLSLAEMKEDSRFADFALVRQGRLSVMAIPEALEGVIRECTGI